MKRHSWIAAAAAAFAALLLIVQAPSLSAQDDKAQPPKKSEQITDLEKQIAEMQKKLEAMKSAQTTTAKKVSPTQLSLPEEWTKAFRWRSIGPAARTGVGTQGTIAAVAAVCRNWRRESGDKLVY